MHRYVLTNEGRGLNINFRKQCVDANCIAKVELKICLSEKSSKVFLTALSLFST